MSSSISIPSGNTSTPAARRFYSSTSSTPADSDLPLSSYSSEAKGKSRLPTDPTPVPERRRTSWLSSSLSKSEHTVVNVGHGADGTPRLITCVKQGQGFDWNTDIFLPSYITDYYDAPGSEHAAYVLERRQDPVEEIFLTEEEERAMFPTPN